MYSEQDIQAVSARIRRGWLVLIPILLVLAGAYIYALAARMRWLAMTAGALFVVAFCYGFLTSLWPNLRYRGFLRDMENGLSRRMRGTIVAISDGAELHDGAMVLPVRVKLAEDENGRPPLRHSSVAAERLSLESSDDTQDERIVYLNVAKRAMMPEPGTAVSLNCFGRHIRSVELL